MRPRKVPIHVFLNSQVVQLLASQGALGIAPVKVGFETPDPCAGLQVVAERTACEPTLGADAEVGTVSGLVRFAPAVAAVDTDIEAGPTKRRDINGRLSNQLPNWIMYSRTYQEHKYATAHS